MPDKIFTATDLANAAASGEPISINGASYTVSFAATAQPQAQTPPPQAPAQAARPLTETSPGYAEYVRQQEAAKAAAKAEEPTAEQLRIAEARATARAMFGKRDPSTRNRIGGPSKPVILSRG